MRNVVKALLAGIVCLSFGTPVLADSQNNLGFNAQPADNTYQQIGYFKFDTKSKQTTDLKIVLTNTTSKKESINATIQNGLSSPNGSTWYTTKSVTKDASLTNLKYAARKYITGPSKITLEPKTSKIVTYTFTAPSVNSGTILGGLSFQRTNSATKTKKTKGITIYTQLARRISVEADYDNQPASHLTIKKPSVSTNPSYPVIKLPLANTSTSILTHFRMSYYLYNSHNKLMFKKITAANQSTIMAPVSRINYSIPWTAKTFAAGKYKLKVHIQTEHQTINKTYPITIHQKTVSHFTKISRTVKVQNNYVWIIVILLSLGLVGAIGYIIYDKHNKHQKSKNR